MGRGSVEEYAGAIRRRYLSSSKREKARLPHGVRRYYRKASILLLRRSARPADGIAPHYAGITSNSNSQRPPSGRL